MTETARYLALLRGINVGGKNIIPMADLRDLVAAQGFTGVRTYIQSGNIVFRAPPTSNKTLTAQLEQALAERFDYSARVVVIDYAACARIMAAAPPGWGADETQKHYVCFVLGDASPSDVLAKLPAPKPAIETVTPGEGVIYWSISKAGQPNTTYARLSSRAAARQLTIRNDRTARKLLAMLAVA